MLSSAINLCAKTFVGKVLSLSDKCHSYWCNSCSSGKQGGNINRPLMVIFQ